ncbi:MAG: class I SAM-dependent methyltransferase [Candidatus Altiarchaeota archaeon]
MEGDELRSAYERRLGGDAPARQRIWGTLCSCFFQKYVPSDAKVLDIGAGFCEFINNIRAAQKTAVDLNPDTRRMAAADVSVVTSPATDLSRIGDSSIDVVFSSNLLEHLPRPDIVKALNEMRRVLKPGGQLLLMVPNIRYCSRDYWMFFDHVTPLDDRALVEVLELNGFRVEEDIPRFLPYTTKSRLPKAPLLVKLYLRLRFLWTIFGQQAFIRAQKAGKDA